MTGPPAPLFTLEAKEDDTTVFTGSLDFQKKKGSFHQTELNTLMTRVPDYLKNYKENGLPVGAALLRTLKLSDGSRILVLEDNSDFNH